MLFGKLETAVCYKRGSWFDTLIITVVVRIVTVMVMLWMKVL